MNQKMKGKRCRLNKLISNYYYNRAGPGFLWDFVRLSLKTCSLYHEKLFIQVVNDISSQVFNNFFSASDFMEAVRGCLCFYRYEKMQGCVIQVRLLRSMHAQDQQKQALQSQFRKKLPKAVDF